MAIKKGSGNPNAKLMVIGEAYGSEEERLGQPFMGAAGTELTRMLQAAGINQGDVWYSNLVNARPPRDDLGEWFALTKKAVTPEHLPLRDKMVKPIVRMGYDSLCEEIRLVNPNVIIPVGNYALWALTGAWGALKWRGSMLRLSEEPHPKVIPTLHPSAVIREWKYRSIVISDLKRAAREAHSREWSIPPREWKFIVRPSYTTVMLTLAELKRRLDRGEKLWIDLDLETRAGHIACCGLSWSLTDALVIPLMCVESAEGYWAAEEEVTIVWALRRVLCHSNVSVRWQNGLYDAQYIWRHWLFVPRGVQDTMLSQHTCFVAMPKSLAFQSSMYSPHYVYWKDDGKTWGEEQNETQLWSYNAQDCVRTREVGESLTETVKALGLEEVEAFQQRLFWPVLRAMQIGVRVLPAARNAVITELQDAIAEREEWLAFVLGHSLNIASPVQMKKLFYEDLKQVPVMTRATKKKPATITCNDEALVTIAKREPLLKPLTVCISDIRTLQIWLKTFAMAKVDSDGRMRCSFNIAGNETKEQGADEKAAKAAPYTYRLSSSENAFGSGFNMQTIPSDKSKSAGKAIARGSKMPIPNLRKMFGPDPGMTFFDADLDRADLQVVVWEADDAMLKAALRQGADIHLLNAYVLVGKEPPPLDELVESHPKYKDHRAPYKTQREFAKVFCHATNYGGSAKTIAGHTGRTIHEVDRAQRIWFGEHPGIHAWHKRVNDQITRYHFISNPFGYRWYIFDRLDNAFTEALAWVPQSTVGNVINRVWMQWHDHLPQVQTLLQVHDSLAGQFPTRDADWIKPRMLELGKIVVPYEDPLVIPLGMGTSEISWGDC